MQREGGNRNGTHDCQLNRSRAKASKYLCAYSIVYDYLQLISQSDANADGCLQFCCFIDSVGAGGAMFGMFTRNYT